MRRLRIEERKGIPELFCASHIPQPQPGSGRCNATYTLSRGEQITATELVPKGRKKGGKQQQVEGKMWAGHGSSEATTTTDVPASPHRSSLCRCSMDAGGPSLLPCLSVLCLQLSSMAEESRHGTPPPPPPGTPRKRRTATAGCRWVRGPNGAPTCALDCHPCSNAIRSLALEIWSLRRGRPPDPTRATACCAGGVRDHGAKPAPMKRSAQAPDFNG